MLLKRLHGTAVRVNLPCSACLAERLLGEALQNGVPVSGFDERRCLGKEVNCWGRLEISNRKRNLLYMISRHS